MEKKNIKINKKEVKKEVKKAKAEKPSVSFSLIEVIIITLMTAIVVSVCSGIIVYKNYDSIVKNYNNSYSTALSEFITTYDHIMESYVEEIDEDKLVDSAIEGMFSYLEDAHTNYLDEETTVTLQEQLKGEYTGIGIEIADTDKGIVIVGVFENSPAQKSGIEVNDKIISVNGVDVTGKGASYISEVIKDKTDKFELTIIRNEETKTFSISTSSVIITSVSSNMYDKTGYLQIDTFSATTYDQFKMELETLESKGIENLIIDVRNNTGGYLSSAYEIADLFIEKGKIIYQLKDKNGNIESFNAKKSAKRNYKIVVLINGGSASASEILAAALKESYGASLLGTKTYGKGTVQETEKLASGSMVKYTTAYWLTPMGVCIDGTGIDPTKEVVLDRTTETDEQLDEALNYIKGI